MDAEAISRVLAGERDAYREVMERHFHAVHRIAFRITGNEGDAEEATQEAFVRAYDSLGSFRQDAAFATWIARIAMNTSINLVRRRRRDLLHDAPRIADEFGGKDSQAERTVQVADGAAGPERMLLEREAAAMRERAMAELTEMERTAFTLRHVEEISIAEIAEALEIAPNAAKQAVFRAVSKLRRALKPVASVAGGVR